MPLQLWASEREKKAENVSTPGGRRKPLERLNSDKEIQGKPSLFLGLSLASLGPIWLNLVRFGSGLGANFNMDNTESVYANSRPKTNMALLPLPPPAGPSRGVRPQVLAPGPDLSL